MALGFSNPKELSSKAPFLEEPYGRPPRIDQRQWASSSVPREDLGRLSFDNVLILGENLRVERIHIFE
jgi:hypothetical protein